MSTPVLPKVIRGPGIVLIGATAFYFTGDLSAEIVRKTDNIETDMFGVFDERSQGGPMVDIKFTPTGVITAAQLAKAYPYGPSSIVAASSVGTSIFTGSPVPATIWTKADGLKAAYARCGVLQSPNMQLSPRKTAFGAMTVRAINKVTVDPTTTGAFKAISAAAFTDVSFDETKVVTDIYTATIGARATPYDAVGARDGFEIEPVIETEDAEDVNIGIADTHITSVRYKLKFAPNNLTEAQVDALANWDGADAILAGQSVARGPESVAEDIIIDADVLTVTLHNMGLVNVGYGVGVKKDRVQELEFAQKMSFTTGVPNPLITFTVN